MAAIEMDFPKYLNDYRLFVYYTIDGIIVGFLSFVVSFWLLSVFVHVGIAAIAGVATGFFVRKNYEKYKEKAPHGALSHILFVLGFRSFDVEDSHIELTDLEVGLDSFFPKGYETEFKN